MANRIKGITIEIGGDTTKLQDALKKVNTEIKHTQSELRDVNKILKMDPGNTDLLAQKQKLLGQSIEGTKEKLNSLKLASEQANAALARGDISQAQYDALQREIIETENALKALEQQASKTGQAFKNISDSSMKISKVTGEVGREMTTKVTAPIVAIGALGLKTAADFEKGMSSVKAITGATGDELSQLKEKALQLGESTSFSASGVTEAMTEMAKAGWSTQDILNGVGGVLDAAAASGENLGSVSTIVADAISGFNMKASESGRVADVLTQAANAGTIGINDLGESFKYVAPLSNSMGFNIEEVTTALTAMSMSGIKGSQAGTSLKNTLTNMIKPTKAMEGVMNELGINITNSDGSFKSLDEIVAILRTSFSGLTDEQKAYYASILAGKEGQAGLLSLLNLTQEEYDAISDSMKNAGGIAKETADVMQDNLASKIEALGGALETLSVRFGDLVIPALTKFVEKITDVVTAISNAPPGVQKLILVFAGILAAIGPVLLVISKVAAVVGTVTGAMSILAGGVTNGATPAMLGLAKVFGVLKTAFTALSGLIMAHPIVAAIVAIATILIPLIIKNWDSIKEFLINTWNSIVTSCQEIWGGIKDFFSGLWTGISETWSSIWTAITTNLSALWTGFISGVSSIWDGIKEFLSNLWLGISESWNTAWTGITAFLNDLWTGFVESIKTLWQGVKDFFSNLWTGLSEGWNSIWTSITTFLSESWSAFIEGAKALWQGLGEFFTSLWTGIQTTFTNIWTAISTTTTEVFTAVGEFIKTTWEGIKTLISTVLDAIKVKVETIWNGLKEFFTTVLTAIGTFINTQWTNIKTNIETTLNNIKSVVQSIWNGIKTFISTTMNNIKSFISSAWNNIKSNISSALNSARSNVSSTFNSMKSSISSTMSNIQSSIRNGFNNAVNFIKNLASQAYQWGADLVNGIARGIRNAIGNVVSAVSDVASTIRSYLHFSVPDVGPLTDYESWMPDFMEGLSKGIEKSRKLVQNSIGNVASDMVLNPNLATVGVGSIQSQSVDIGSQIETALSNLNLKSENIGDIVIPVYLGGTLLDEVIVNANQRRNLRSGGR